MIDLRPHVWKVEKQRFEPRQTGSGALTHSVPHSATFAFTDVAQPRQEVR